MLVLTRRIGETLVIDNNTEITVFGVSGNQVRMGINAPKEISVHRQEIQKRINAEQVLLLQEHIHQSAASSGVVH